MIRPSRTLMCGRHQSKYVDKYLFSPKETLKIVSGGAENGQKRTFSAFGYSD